MTSREKSWLVWEGKGQKGVALYSEQGNEWLVLPDTSSTHLLADGLQRMHDRLGPEVEFTNYAFVCELLAGAMARTRDFKRLAMDGIVSATRGHETNTTQRNLTLKSMRVWATDHTAPSRWLQGELWDSMVGCGAVVRVAGGQVRRVFVVPEPMTDQYMDELFQVIFIHRRLGIDVGLVDESGVRPPLPLDGVLYDNAVVFQESRPGHGVFRADKITVDGFADAYAELWDRGGNAAERRARHGLESWTMSASKELIRRSQGSADRADKEAEALTRGR